MYNGCPTRVDVPYQISGHIVKGQGQTAGFWKDGVSLKSIAPIAGEFLT